MPTPTTTGDPTVYRCGPVELVFQHDVRPDLERNGALATEVIDALHAHLTAVSRGTPDRETAMALLLLREAGNWLKERHRLRVEQGVYGTMTPHQ